MKITQIINGKPSKKAVPDEIVAVITATVKAVMESGSYNLSVRSFRRSAPVTPVWSMVSRKDLIDSRRMI